MKETNENFFQVFGDIASFSRAIESAAGHRFDLASVSQLHTDFIDAAEGYLFLNIKEYGVEKSDNMLFLSEDKVYAFSSNIPSSQNIKTFETILNQQQGKGTVFCFLVLDSIVDNHKKRLEEFIKKIETLEANFDHTVYRTLSFEMEHFNDRLEEFHELLLELEERRYGQINTQYLAFDYGVLIAESSTLQSRCRRRMSGLKELRQEHEMQNSEELNQRIVRLNDVVRRLTAITVIFMVPTLIASHFGMNFRLMPELYASWGYPSAIAAEIVVIIAGIVIFKKMGWL